MSKNRKLQGVPRSEETIPTVTTETPTTVPITPQMREILQALANEMDRARNIAQAHENNFAQYIMQCGQLLGLTPETVDRFDVPLAAFVLKPTQSEDPKN